MQSGFDGLYMSYLYGKVKDKFSYLPSKIDFEKKGDTMVVAFETEKKYCPYVRKFTEDNISDIIAVGYKYQYFQKRLTLPLLNEKEKRLLFTALAAADLKEDREIVAETLCGAEQYCLDGFFHFRLQELQRRWDGIAEYIPADFGKQSLEGFVSFLVEDGEGKIFLKDGKAYDETYRVLSKSALTGESSLVGEILLLGAERVYCFGKPDQETDEFLRKYYKGKVIFC